MTENPPSLTPPKVGRKPLKLNERTVKTTIRLPAGLLAEITALVGDQRISKFFREAAQAKLKAQRAEAKEDEPD